MKRTRRFAADFEVPDAFLRQYRGSVRDEAERVIWERLSGTLRGPRGGAYEPIGEVSEITQGQPGDAWLRGVTIFRGRRMARYVRPKQT